MSGAHLWLSLLLCSLCAQQVSSSGCSVSPDKACNFVCDCWDCSDEHACGYHSKSAALEIPFACDFEEDTCGWRDVSTSAYRWTWDRDGISMYGTGPLADHTFGTPWGWYMAAESHRGKTLATASLRSPVLRDAAATCEVRIHYHMWEAGWNEFSQGSLSVQLSDTIQVFDVWHNPQRGVYDWREIVFYTGRISGEFQITVSSTRNFSARGDLAIDDVSFHHCALPQPQQRCPQGWFQCSGGSCVEQDRVCDGTNDCGSGNDEANCSSYHTCPFEKDFCSWTKEGPGLSWVLTRNSTAPSRDHTSNSLTGYFLFAGTSSDGKGGTARLLSPILNATSDDSCFMVLYYLMSGSSINRLNIYYRTSYPGSLTQLGGQQGEMGDHWFRDRVVFNVSQKFQIVVEGVVGEGETRGIALDDLILSPGCAPLNESLTNGTEPQPPTNPFKNGQFRCDNETNIPENQTCNFKDDCGDGSDEKNCGAVGLKSDTWGWTDHSVGRLKWVKADETLPSHILINSLGESYMSLQGAGGQMLSAAEMRTPPLGPSGAACAMQLSYLNSGDAGVISASVIDSKLGTNHLSWYVQRQQGRAWTSVTIPLGERPRPFQVMVLGWLPPHVDVPMSVALSNISFVDCHPDTLNDTKVSCNFEVGMCGWYQDQRDDFEWALGGGYDHTTGTGHFMYADTSSGLQRGIRTRLHTYLQKSDLAIQCLSFWYYMYGPQIGTLNLKIRYDGVSESLLWSRTGTHGNTWHLGFETLRHKGPTQYQLVFEVLRGGSMGHIAIDDITLQSGPCVAQRDCSFEGGFCGYSSQGKYTWVRQSNFTGTTREGPAIDHTLETIMGQYMIVDTSKAAMPSGTTALMNSEQHEPFSGDMCLGLWYHMSHNSAGTLNIYVEEQKKKKQVLTLTNNPGGTWHYSSTSIQAEKAWNVILEAVGAGAELSFIAVDDIHLSPSSCPKPGTCDFELNTCGWSTTKNGRMDAHDWAWSSGAGHGGYQAPKADHTLGTKDGHYIFFDTDRLNPGDSSAWLLSEQLLATTGSCLKFWYRTDSEDELYPGELRVKTYSSAGQLTVWSMQKHRSAGWQEGRILVTSSAVFQLVFEAAKGNLGASGPVVLDDIEYITGGNCDPAKNEEKAADKTDNTGVIVFGVILGTILLVVSVALILRWVRKKQQAQLAEEPAHVEGLAGFDNLTFQEDHIHVGEDSP